MSSNPEHDWGRPSWPSDTSSDSDRGNDSGGCARDIAIAAIGVAIILTIGLVTVVTAIGQG